MTLPTQAQIEAAAKAAALTQYKKWDGLSAVIQQSYIEIAKAAITAAAEVDNTEWKCADCDHVQRGHRFKCEKCGANFGTVAAAGEQTTLDKCLERINATGKALEAATIERCAQVLNDYLIKFQDYVIKFQNGYAQDVQFSTRAVVGIIANLAGEIRSMKGEK